MVVAHIDSASAHHDLTAHIDSASAHHFIAAY